MQRGTNTPPYRSLFQTPLIALLYHVPLVLARALLYRPAKGLGSRDDAKAPPNRYWPIPGGPKEFLCPFIERNRKHLWAYDPALKGMDHVQAYRHIINRVCMKTQIICERFQGATMCTCLLFFIGTTRSALCGAERCNFASFNNIQ